jgi:hypothetical protein
MFVIYHKQTTQIVGKDLKPDHRARYKSMAAAKAAITRAAKKMGNYTGGLMLIDPNHPLYVYGIARDEGFFTKIEKRVVKTNLMSGKEYTESVNTPLHMSPASETYWSM